MITLGIIGIVAAMTMPALMHSVRHRTASARLKKFYSTMKQGLLKVEDDYGTVGGWNMKLSFDDFVDTYFVPYFQITKDVNGNVIYFNDGSSYSYDHHGTCLDMVYDINGKGSPNKLGYDRFVFLFCDSGNAGSDCCLGSGFCSYRCGEVQGTRTREASLQRCKSDAHHCSALLEYDKWEFRSDYPY